MDAEIVKYIVEGLAGPAAAMLILLAVLFGVWKLVNKGLDALSKHLENIEQLFGESKNELKELNTRVHEIGNTLDKHIIIVDTRINALENRIDKLEERKSR